MRILALRLAAFRRFSAPVAIEDFDAGLNVLAGPNEFGKSTIFQVLEAAFLLRHGTSGAGLDALRPRTGGEPLVEVDFETAEGRWRIRKQYGRGKAAILTDLKTSKPVALAADAEDRLATLAGVGADGPGRMGLVWVRQQRALLPPDPDIDPQTGKAKPRGEASALVDLLGREVEAAAGAGAAARINHRVKAALGELVTPGREGAKKGGAYELALRAREEARRHLANARQMADAGEQRLTRIAAMGVSLAALESPEARAGEQQRIAVLENKLNEAVVLRSSRDVLAAEFKSRDLEAASARQALDAHIATSARRAGLEEAIAAAQALESEIRFLAGELNTCKATPTRLQLLFELERDVAVARGELSSRSATVEISPLPEAEGRISANGVSIRSPAHIDVDGRLDIVIEGVGSIGVVTADPAKAASAKARLEAAESGFQTCLSEIGVTTSREARTRGAARAQNAASLDQARARLSGLAPKGIAVLAQELASLSQHGTQSGSGGQPERAAELEREALAREAAARSARRDYEAAKAAAPDDAAFRALSAELEAARQSVVRMAGEARRIAVLLEGLKGEQSGVDEDGRAGEVPQALGKVERAEREVKRLEAEIAALRLLSATLSDAETSIRNRYFEPVARAIAPYLARLFPEAGIDFKDKFSLEALSRAGEKEEFATLSDGTREQLAILVRMSFAKLIAERGAAMPLILDDPLVYSDDARLDAMCRALEDAALGHQVVLLTCREKAFENITGRRLAITSWQPV